MRKEAAEYKSESSVWVENKGRYISIWTVRRNSFNINIFSNVNLKARIFVVFCFWERQKAITPNFLMESVFNTT